jgi:hypothetical protein
VEENQHTTPSSVVSTPEVPLLANGCTVVGAMAGAGTAVLDLGPEAIDALDLFLGNYPLARISKLCKDSNLDVSTTYHASPVATAEMSVSIRSLAGTVRTSLVTAIAGTADVSGIQLGNC